MPRVLWLRREKTGDRAFCGGLFALPFLGFSGRDILFLLCPAQPAAALLKLRRAFVFSRRNIVNAALEAPLRKRRRDARFI